MKRTPTSNAAVAKLQRGIALMESLIAIVIAALGILGILGIQMRTLTDTSTTVRRAQAIRLIEDLSERMKVNPNALTNINAYVSGFNDQPTPGSCTNGCSAAQQASYDLAIWKQTVTNSLPLGQANIFLAAGETQDSNRRQLGVMISWRENEQAGNKTDDIDATKVRAENGDLNDGANIDCPEGRVCHLQYIPVSARCAPYNDGSGTFTFYCS